MQVNVTKEKLLALLPQRPPMLLIDELVSVDSDDSCCEASTRLMVSADCALVYAGHLTEAGIVENLAQSAAAMIGWNNRNGAPPAIRYLCQIKRFHIHSRPLVGDVLCSTVATSATAGGVVIVRCNSSIGDTTIVEGLLKIQL